MAKTTIYDVDPIGALIVILALGGAIAMSISAYQDGESEKLEIKLKIEQEKTKQLNHGADTTYTGI
jgi:hypothetical protein